MNFNQDLADAMRFFNPDSPIVLQDLKDRLKKMPLDYDVNEEHKKISSEIMEHIRKNTNVDLSQLVLRAANLRRFLG